MNDGFVFYASFYDALSELPDAQRVQAYDVICRYAIYGEEPECSGIIKAVFRLVKPQIDANNKRREAGRRGGQAERKQTEASMKQTEAKPKQIEANQKQIEPKVKEKEKGKGKEKENIIQRSGIAPDSEMGKEIQNFIDHRKQMRKPMTDHAIELFIGRVQTLADNDADRVKLIQTAIERGWQTVYPEKEEKKPVNRFNNFEPRSYDFDDLETQLLRASR